MPQGKNVNLVDKSEALVSTWFSFSSILDAIAFGRALGSNSRRVPASAIEFLYGFALTPKSN